MCCDGSRPVLCRQGPRWHRSGLREVQPALRRRQDGVLRLWRADDCESRSRLVFDPLVWLELIRYGVVVQSYTWSNAPAAGTTTSKVVVATTTTAPILIATTTPAATTSKAGATTSKAVTTTTAASAPSGSVRTPASHPLADLTLISSHAFHPAAKRRRSRRTPASRTRAATATRSWRACTRPWSGPRRPRSKRV